MTACLPPRHVQARSGREARAERRMNAEHREEVAGRLDGGYPRGLQARLVQGEHGLPPGRGVGEHVGQASVVAEVDGRDWLAREPLALVGLPDHHEVVGLAERQRPEHDRFEHAEDSGCGADADRQRQHDGEG